MGKPVQQMSPEELQAHFTAEDLKAMADAAAGNLQFDPGFRERLAAAADLASSHAASTPGNRSFREPEHDGPAERVRE